MERMWTFEALDRWFFRDGRPMNMGEMSWVDSVFPPTGQSLQGAIRASVIDYVDGDFDRFRAGDHVLNEHIGDADGLGNLKLTGPFVARNEELLFPAPLDLVRSGPASIDLLAVSDESAIECDLGTIRLPRAGARGGKTLDGWYLTRPAMEACIAGKCDELGTAPAHGENMWQLFAAGPGSAGLVDREPAVGLARSDRTRAAETGYLYAIGYVRPRTGVTLAVVVNGLPNTFSPIADRLARFGGEGRLARVRVDSPKDNWLPARPELVSRNGRLRFKLVFTTPFLVSNSGFCWPPSGFAPHKDRRGLTVWNGRFGKLDTELRILSACIGRTQRIGGWNLAVPGSRPVLAYAPAGSVLFCETNAENLAGVESIHGTHLGLRTEFGYGHVLVGCW